jgi:integrase
MRGSVRKRGSTWTWYLSIEPDPVTGKRRQRSKGGFRTKRECQEALNEALAALRTGTYVELSQRTLGAFLVDEWLPAIRPPKMRPSTWLSYQKNVERHIVPALGHLPIQRLTPAQLAAFYRSLLEHGRRDGRGGLAPKTIRNIHGALHAALKDAVRWGYVARNVAAAADLPKGMLPEMHVWSPEQLRAFLDHVRGDRLYAAWLLLATTGMRRGEVAGLRWVDVDLDAGRVSPRRPRVVVNYEVVVSEPKTAKGRRSLALDAATAAALLEHRVRQLEERLAVGPRWQGLRPGVHLARRPTAAPGAVLQVVRAARPGGRTAEDPAARRPPQLRHRGACRRHPGQGRLGAARPRQHRHHHGHLQPRAARPGRPGGRHGRPAYPGRHRPRAGPSR